MVDGNMYSVLDTVILLLDLMNQKKTTWLSIKTAWHR